MEFKKSTALIIFLCLSLASAWANVKVKAAVDGFFKDVDEIKPKTLILSGSEFQKIQQTAKTSVPTKVYRYYEIFSQGKSIATAILISKKVRTKKATVLYVFDTKGKLRLSEIMAFSEPPEFLPSQKWMSQLQNKDPNAPLRIGKDISTISGATLSARSITEGARIARAIYDLVLKEKQ